MKAKHFLLASALLLWTGVSENRFRYSELYGGRYAECDRIRRR